MKAKISKMSFLAGKFAQNGLTVKASELFQQQQQLLEEDKKDSFYDSSVSFFFLTEMNKAGLNESAFKDLKSYVIKNQRSIESNYLLYLGYTLSKKELDEIIGEVKPSNKFKFLSNFAIAKIGIDEFSVNGKEFAETAFSLIKSKNIDNDFIEVIAGVDKDKAFELFRKKKDAEFMTTNLFNLVKATKDERFIEETITVTKIQDENEFNTLEKDKNKEKFQQKESYFRKIIAALCYLSAVKNHKKYFERAKKLIDARKQIFSLDTDCYRQLFFSTAKFEMTDEASIFLKQSLEQENSSETRGVLELFNFIQTLEIIENISTEKNNDFWLQKIINITNEKSQEFNNNVLNHIAVTYAKLGNLNKAYEILNPQNEGLTKISDINVKTRALAGILRTLALKNNEKLRIVEKYLIFESRTFLYENRFNLFYR